jgi:hypothetical protein
MTKKGELFLSFTQGCGCCAALRLGYYLSLLRSFGMEEDLFGASATLRYNWTQADFQICPHRARI